MELPWRTRGCSSRQTPSRMLATGPGKRGSSRICATAAPLLRAYSIQTREESTNVNRSIVAIAKGPPGPDDAQVDALVREAVVLSGGLADLVSRGDTVIIKPNLIAPAPPEQAATTDYRVCRSIANQVRELGARPIIAEGSATGFDTEDAFGASRYDLLRDQGYEVVDLKKTPTVRVPVPKGTAVRDLLVPELVLKADAIINVPKMKTHGQVLATLAIKNMKGILPDTLKKKFHTTYGVFQSVAELVSVVTPALNIIDGIIAQEGMGPVLGTPVAMGLIIAGRDPVAVDTVTALVMGINPDEMETSRYAAQLGLGTMRIDEIDVVGKTIEQVRRRFKLSSEAMCEVLRLPPDFELVFNEAACTGCRNGVLATLKDLQLAGDINVLSGLRIICGKTDNGPAQSEKRTLLVGACTARHRSEYGYLEGCPPNCVDVLAAIKALV